MFSDSTISRKALFWYFLEEQPEGVAGTTDTSRLYIDLPDKTHCDLG
jgi:hypothetical protein